MNKELDLNGVTTTIQASSRINNYLGQRKVRDLMQRSDKIGLIYTFGHFLLIAATGYLLYLSLDSAWVYPAVLLHGFVIVHLFSPYHECSHNTTFKTPWINSTVYWLIGLILFLPPLVFKYEHADHHTYTQDPKRDTQLIFGQTWKGFLAYGSALPYFFNIFRKLLLEPFGWLNAHSKRATPEIDRWLVQRQAIIFVLIYATIAGVSIWFESTAALVYWIIPRIVAEPIERVIRMAEHVGCPVDDPNPLTNSRTVLTNKFFMALSWNMPYHAAHHAIPLVPFHSLPELTRILGDKIECVDQGYPQTLIKQYKMLMKNTGRSGGELVDVA